MIEMIYFERFEDKKNYEPTKYLVTFECDKKDVYKLLELANMEQAANAHSCIVKEDDYKLSTCCVNADNYQNENITTTLS